MKKLLYLTTLYFLLTTCTYSQWWVQGGNLIWPYGNVNITKGDLTLNKGTLFIDTIISTGKEIKIKLGSFYSPGFDEYYSVFDFEGDTTSVHFKIGAEPEASLILEFDSQNGLTVDEAHIGQLDGVAFITLPNKMWSVSDPPTHAELNSSFSTWPNETFHLIKDTDTNKRYIIYKYSNQYWYFEGTVAQ